MNALDFKYSWFGFWREQMDSYAKFPSIMEFVDKDYSENHNVSGILNYLKSGHALAYTSGWSFNHPFKNEPVGGSIATMTDGKFLWYSDLAEYIEDFNVAIPENWYQYMKLRNFKVDDLSHLADHELKQQLETARNELSLFLE